MIVKLKNIPLFKLQKVSVLDCLGDNTVKITL